MRNIRKILQRNLFPQIQPVEIHGDQAADGEDQGGGVDAAAVSFRGFPQEPVADVSHGDAQDRPEITAEKIRIDNVKILLVFYPALVKKADEAVGVELTAGQDPSFLQSVQERVDDMFSRL